MSRFSFFRFMKDAGVSAENPWRPMQSRARIFIVALLFALPLALRAHGSATAVFHVTLPGQGPATLLVEPVNLYAPGIRVTQMGADGVAVPSEERLPDTFRGSVQGDPTSLVRLTSRDGWIAGVVRSEGLWYSIQPDDWTTPSSSVVRVIDVPNLPAPSVHNDTATPVGVPLGVGVGNCTIVACDRLSTRIVLDGDVFFRNLGTSTCAARQTSVFNAVEAIYDDSPMKIDLTVAQVNCRTSASLGNTSTRISAYLSNLRDSWNFDIVSDRSSVVLASGIDFPSGDPIGLAYLPGVCARVIAPVVTGTVPQTCPDGYAVYQAVAEPGTTYTATEFMKAKLFAHELGHNFNAEHDTGSQCKTTSPYNGPIMCPFLQVSGPNTFSPVSAAAIRDHAEESIGSITGT